MCVCVCFPFGFEGGILDLIVVKQNQGRTSSSPPVFLLLVVPRRLFCFGSLVFFLSTLRCGVWLRFVILVRYTNRKAVKIDVQY